MAVVRFSDEFKESIISNAKKMFEARLEAQRKAVPQIGDAIAATVFGPLMPSLLAINSKFLSWTTDFQIGRIGKTRYDQRYTLTKPYPKPHDDVTNPDGTTIHSNYVMSVDVPATPNFLVYAEQLDQWKSGTDAIIAQRDEFVDGVKKVINAHSTLAPALKAWPPLWDLVSETYRERHRKVVERSKTEAGDIDVDLTKLTATVTINKFTK